VGFIARVTYMQVKIKKLIIIYHGLKRRACWYFAYSSKKMV